MLILLLRGILLGFGAAAPIGPVNIEIARRTLHSGFAAGFITGCGAVSIDVVYALLTSFGVRFLSNNRIFYWTLTAAGVLLLAYLGISSLRAGLGALRRADQARWQPVEPNRPHWSARRAYLTGLLMTASNPMTLAFWFIAVPATAGRIAAHPQRDLPIICTGVFIGAASWVVGFAGLLSLAANRGARQSTRLPAFADLVGGIILVVFAALTLWNSLDPLL